MRKVEIYVKTWKTEGQISPKISSAHFLFYYHKENAPIAKKQFLATDSPKFKASKITKETAASLILMWVGCARQIVFQIVK